MVTEKSQYRRKRWSPSRGISVKAGIALGPQLADTVEKLGAQTRFGFFEDDRLRSFHVIGSTIMANYGWGLMKHAFYAIFRIAGTLTPRPGGG